MDKELKGIIEAKITAFGYRKNYVAKQIGLDPVRFSQTLSGKRNLSPMELSGLKNLLKF